MSLEILNVHFRMIFFYDWKHHLKSVERGSPVKAGEENGNLLPDLFYEWRNHKGVYRASPGFAQAC